MISKEDFKRLRRIKNYSSGLRSVVEKMKAKTISCEISINVVSSKETDEKSGYAHMFIQYM